MYSIQTIIYGIPLTTKANNIIDKWEKTGDVRWDGDGRRTLRMDCGFTQLYSGSSSGNVGYCGVKLGQLDECGDYVAMNNDHLIYHCLRYSGGGIRYTDKKIYLKPTAKQIAAAKKKIAKLDKKLLDACPPIGVYMIYSTS